MANSEDPDQLASLKMLTGCFLYQDSDNIFREIEDRFVTHFNVPIAMHNYI